MGKQLWELGKVGESGASDGTWRKAAMLSRSRWISRAGGDPLRLWVFRKHPPLAVTLTAQRAAALRSGNLLCSSRSRDLSMLKVIKQKCHLKEMNSWLFPGWVLALQAPKVCRAFCLTKPMCSLPWIPLTSAQVARGLSRQLIFFLLGRNKCGFTILQYFACSVGWERTKNPS